MTGASAFGRVHSYLARELVGAPNVWIAETLIGLRELIQVPHRSDAHTDIAILAATEVDETGTIVGVTCPMHAGRVWALFNTPMRIVQSCAPPVSSTSVCKVERVFGELGVLDVTDDGLVVTALAAGISAKQLQCIAEPTLKISSRVGVMQDNVSRAGTRVTPTLHQEQP